MPNVWGIKALTILAFLGLAYSIYLILLLPLYTYSDRPTLDNYDSAREVIEEKMASEFNDASDFQEDFRDRPIDLQLTYSQAQGVIRYRNSMLTRINMLASGRTQLQTIAFASTAILFTICYREYKKLNPKPSSDDAKM